MAGGRRLGRSPARSQERLAIKFPYGISDFRQVIGEGYYFVDRSDHIHTLEEMGKQMLFLRPRRFGKSLLLSMLENYYDVTRAGEFEQLSSILMSLSLALTRRVQDLTLKNAAKCFACALCAFLRLTKLSIPVILAPSYGLEAVSKIAR